MFSICSVILLNMFQNYEGHDFMILCENDKFVPVLNTPCLLQRVLLFLTKISFIENFILKIKSG